MTVGLCRRGEIVLWLNKSKTQSHTLVVRHPYPQGFEEFVEVSELGRPGHPLYIPRDTIVLTEGRLVDKPETS